MFISSHTYLWQWQHIDNSNVVRCTKRQRIMFIWICGRRIKKFSFKWVLDDETDEILSFQIFSSKKIYTLWIVQKRAIRNFILFPLFFSIFSISIDIKSRFFTILKLFDNFISYRIFSLISLCVVKALSNFFFNRFRCLFHFHMKISYKFNVKCEWERVEKSWKTVKWSRMYLKWIKLIAY